MNQKQKNSQSSSSGEVIKTAKNVAKQKVAAGSLTQVQVLLGEKDGAPNFALRQFTMEKGGGMPLHTNTVEHEQYVLQGKGRIVIGKTVHEVEAGDVIYIPAGTPHSYEVLQAPFEFLCVVPNTIDQLKILDNQC